MSSHKGYYSEENIFALSTSIGGVISVVRISGLNLEPALFQLLGEHKVKKLLIEPSKLIRVDLFSSLTKKKIDDAMVVYFKNPKSYTGEDVVEFFIHGSVIIIQNLMESLIHLKFRQALPGEFSFRAVRNGKLSLSQAEAVSELITSKNSEALTIALEKLEGSQHKFLLEISDELKNIAAFGELSLDFSDQDIESLHLDSLKKRLNLLLYKLLKLEKSFQRGKYINEGVKVSILGLPNAGKSSFFNQILGEDRSIVTSIAGTTRDLIRETITLKNKDHKSVSIRFEDTAGIHESENQVEKIGILKSIQSAKNAEVILLCCDISEQNELALKQWLNFSEYFLNEFKEEISIKKHKLYIIFTKKDQIKDPIFDAYLSPFKHISLECFQTSSETREGIDEVVEELVNCSLHLMEREQNEIILTRLDHVNAVSETILHLNRGLSAMSEDLFAADIRQALVSLSPVIGDFLPDDILGKIFSEFCIGK